MIEINLLPLEHRSVKTYHQYHKPALAAAIIIFLFFVLIALNNLFQSTQLSGQNKALVTQWKKIEGLSREADQLQMALGSSTLSEIQFYDAFIAPPFETAFLLNLASDLLPDDTTLKEFEIERKGLELKMTLGGYSDTHSKGSKLIEIQNYGNEIKKQIEKLMAPKQGELIPPGGNRTLNVEVTTNSKEEEGTKTLTTEFTMILTSLGFSKK